VLIIPVCCGIISVDGGDHNDLQTNVC
jgi:hypothetical protein